MSGSRRFGLCYLDCGILHWTCQDIKYNGGVKLLGCTEVSKFPVLCSKCMMENMTIFKYVTRPVVGSYLIPLKPVEDLLMVSVELGTARRMQKCC